MDRVKAIRGAVSLLCGYAAAKLGILAPWLGVLVAAMALDYLTGMGAAAYNGCLSSKTGIKGIGKKLAYLSMVAVSVITDWVICSGGELIGLKPYPQGTVALAVIMWLIVNELISVLENAGRMGVPLPAFLFKLIRSLKEGLEHKGNNGDQ